VDSREIKSKNKSDEKISDKPAKKDRRLGKSKKEVKQGGNNETKQGFYPY